MQALLADVPGVEYVEGWAVARSELLLDNGSPGDHVQLMAPPAGSTLVVPVLLQGRWIVPGDQNAIVLNDQFLANYPDLKVGDTIRLRVNDEDIDWRIVGFFQLSGKLGGYMAYANYDYLSTMIHQHAQANMFRVVAKQPGGMEDQKRLARTVEAKLKANNVSSTEISTGSHIGQNSAQAFSILTAFLMFMAILIALGVLLSFPVSKVLADSVNLAIFGSASKLGFTIYGFVIWLALVIALSVSASILPARNASRLTIREVLAYE